MLLRRSIVPSLLTLLSLVASEALLGASPGSTEAQPDETPAERLDALFESTFESRLDHDPSLANTVGDARSPGRMTVDLSGEHRGRSREIFQEAAREIDSIPFGELDHRRRTWAEAFRWDVQMHLQLLDQPTHLLPLVPGADLPSRFAQLAAGDSDLAMDSAADLRAYASRARDLSRWVDLAIENLRHGMAQGFVHPKLVVGRQLRALAGIAGGSLEDTVFQRPIDAARELDLSADQRTALLDELEVVTRIVILPAYARLHAFLRDEYLNAARPGLALDELEGGDELYRVLVRFFTTTDLNPEEIFAIGEEESRHWQKRLRHLRRLEGSGSRYTTDDDRVMATFRRLADDVDSKLDRLFLHRPAAPLAIRFVEPHMASLGAAFYSRPPADGSRPGTFFVRPGGFDLATAEALFLHEALPGHHFQIALAQEQEDVPAFLRYGYFGAFIEGWGLYAESLGDELGLYRDPSSRLGRIRFALGRAGRLVGDVGIHARGWDLDEARSRLGRRQLDWARSEIGRYATIPGQALSYTLGERMISQLRSRAEDALGSDFDVRHFHAEVLRDGPLPLVVLESKIDRWIEMERPRTGARATGQADSAAEASAR